MILIKDVTTREGQNFPNGVFIRYDILILEDELKVKFALRYYENEETFKAGVKTMILKDIPSNYICTFTKNEFKKMNSKTIAFREYLESRMIKEVEKVTGERTISNL